MDILLRVSKMNIQNTMTESSILESMSLKSTAI